MYPVHPYILDGPAYWLSEGVRVFRATEDVERFGATPAVGATPGAIPANARTYLTQVLADLNGPGGAATWAQMPADQLASALQIWPTDDMGRTVLNFALAKLTCRGSVDATAVRLFFRLCSVIATGLNYDPSGAYRNFDPVGAGGPVVPRLGLTTNSGTGQREITTIPCFAEPRANTDARRRTRSRWTRRPTPPARSRGPAPPQSTSTSAWGSTSTSRATSASRSTRHQPMARGPGIPQGRRRRSC